MSRKQHNQYDAMKALSKKQDIRFTSDSEILLLHYKSDKRQNDLGNGSWGKIDYLVNHCGFRLVTVSSF